ncbi:hypothetical protein ACRRS0_15360 [Agarivorans sp. QJM3NY_29]|uniref:hypothetical protein n=1 Tax=unclassified Agarivorans TaxID=2636026 RepID=UPI003D7D3355
MWLNFITLNSVAPIPNLHQISDAGAGDGLMQLHPSRDTELIACGQANTLLDGQFLPSPELANGSVTPAILVHGIFRALQAKGYKIRLHCYQLGLEHEPDFNGSMVDHLVVHHCALGAEQQLMQQQLIPELKRQAAAGERHLIAESGIGGTSFASLWLRRWLGQVLSFAGSTKDPEKLRVKEQLIESLLSQTAQLPLAVEPYVASLQWSDPIQRACCALLDSELVRLDFAGGVMMFAPVIAMQHQLRDKQLSIATTRWVMASGDSQIIAAALPANCRVLTPELRFDGSKFKALQMYERGYVIEGCGLGACLVFAEQQAIKPQQLLASLDRAVTPWLKPQQQQQGSAHASMH